MKEGDHYMFIAMNRFKVISGYEHEFETVWRDRDTHLSEVEGFLEFHLIKATPSDNFILYASHTVWKSKEHFERWTKSEAFRKAHRNAGENSYLYLDHPNFEGFEVVI